ncbi:ATPase [Tsukamurella pulmonis]|uniref:Uncharacterized conserved protein YndB, AHSA1/START domain n=1 Tax=Tsukamurella pulmonis TaxID=47312 RepID=A0A1H1EI10_9ACTN|nr:SRPBCC family protein [Tsukamurella pulmonis]KXO91926.1 ATPase [Tsukamurella pulmonis]KXP09576.1 ATPase [Tsukamurella pulmonis]SDQ88435.1 Uncharacterized conserved protein YndB, AHSA1/START domain [Tsukamurella pulmonis]SUP20847.1 Activator of Hsp90 ATPase homolog 1-like protein [Tsukamurella pulmonis]
MTKQATGRVEPTGGGRDLILERYFDADVEDVWASITEPGRTARWFGAWTGEPGAGSVVQVTMGFEDGAPVMPMTITVCEPPRRLRVHAKDEYGEWDLEALVERDGGRTRLTFVHHLDDAANAAEVGPGWEYYLDALVAVESGDPAPDFDDYYPAMAVHYGG